MENKEKLCLNKRKNATKVQGNEFVLNFSEFNENHVLPEHCEFVESCEYVLAGHTILMSIFMSTYTEYIRILLDFKHNLKV